MVATSTHAWDDQWSVSHLNDERAEVLRVSNAHRVGRRAVLGHLHLLRTVGSRAGLLGGVCTIIHVYKLMMLNQSDLH